MRLILLTIFLVLFVGNTYTQGWLPSGSRSMQMGNASSTLNDVWAYYNNPGALADVDELSVGISYENRFLLKELQTQGLAVAIPIKVGVISVGGHMYGYNQFRSYKAGLGYSMKLSERFYTGVQMNYQGLSLNENYGSTNSLTAEAGLYAKFNDKWRLGVSIFNVGRTKLSDFEDDRFSTIMRLGSSYHFSEKVMVAVEVEKDLEHTPRIKSGIEYQVIENLFVRGGFATSRTEMSFGFGYNFKVLQLDLGSSYDQILGWSPNFSLTYTRR